jgi:hypothetical protein
MKKTSVLIMALTFVSQILFGQGTMVFDQQSSTDEYIPSYGDGTVMLQIFSPWGQSFTPSLTGVDFIRLKRAQLTLSGESLDSEKLVLGVSEFEQASDP